MPVSRPFALAFVYGAALFQGLALVILPAVSELLERRYDVSPALYGALYLPMVAVAALTALAATPGRTGWSLRTLFGLGLLADAVALMCLALPAWGIVGTRTPLIAGTLVLGCAFGLMGIALNAAVLSLFAPNPTRNLGWMHGTVGIGAALCPLWVAGWDRYLTWWGGTVALALVGLALAAASRWLDRASMGAFESDLRTGVGTGAAVGTGAGVGPGVPVPNGGKGRRLRLCGHAMVAGLYGALEATFASWAVLFLTVGTGLPSASAAGALSLFWLAMTGGRLLAAPLIDRGSARAWVGVLCAGCAVGLWSLPGIDTATRAGSTYALCGLACSVLFPMILGAASRDFPASAASVSSWVTAALMVGLGLGAFWVGPVSEVWGFATTFRIGALLPALLAALFVALQRSGQTRQHRDECHEVPARHHPEVSR